MRLSASFRRYVCIVFVCERAYVHVCIARLLYSSESRCGASCGTPIVSGCAALSACVCAHCVRLVVYYLLYQARLFELRLRLYAL